MSRPLRLEFPGALFHITARGNERSAIYRDDADRQTFLQLLSKTVAEWAWICHAHCLMGNHYHLVIEIPEGHLSRGMRQLNGEYTRAFNRLHRRCGHLFQGRYHAVLVEKQSHLLELCRYVVLNPVRARGMRLQDPGQWPWSSYRATAGIAPAPSFLRTDWVLAQFHREKHVAEQAYVRFVREGIASAGPLKPRDGLWLGGEEFGRLLHQKAEGYQDIQEHPRVQRFAGRAPLESYLPPDIVTDLDARNEGIARAYREGRYTQSAIANHLGLHFTTVSGILRKVPATPIKDENGGGHDGE